VKVPWTVGRKCCLCKKGGELLFIPEYGIYGEEMSKYAYHEKCIQKISSEPEKYGHKLVDLCLHIVDLIETHTKHLKELKDIYSLKEEKLREYSKRIPWWELEKFRV
jgi:hypothetical protein